VPAARPDNQEDTNVFGDLKNLVLLFLAVLTLTMPAAWGPGAQAAAQQAQALPIGAPGDALDPRKPPFNAVPNDGLDDREQLQQWIDAGCASANKLLYLPPGDWHVTRRPQTDPDSRGSLRILCDGLTLLGAGRTSRIVMLGSGMLPTSFMGPANWWVFDIRGKGVTLEGIAIDGAQRSDTGEQTHLVQLIGPARDVELRRLYLNMPVLPAPKGSVSCKPAESDPDYKTRKCLVPEHGTVLCKDLGDRPSCSVSDNLYTVLGWFRGGDCIRSVGEVATPVDGVSVTDSYAPECDRSFIALQRASYNFTITGNVTKKVTDQIIDQEPSGAGGIGKIFILGNRFERGGAASQGGAAITLTGIGTGADLGDSMVVANNVLDGGIITFNVGRISIEHNIINGQASASNIEPVIHIVRHTESLRLIGNEIDRPAAAGPGPVILARLHNTDWPVDVTMALNTIRQNTDGNVIELNGVQNATIADNTIHCNQPTDDRFAAVAGRSAPPQVDNPATLDVDETRPPLPLEGLIVAQNRARGRCDALVDLLPHSTPPVPIGAVTVTGNQTKGLSVGVLFEAAILPSVKPRISDNLFEGTAPANFVKGPQGFTFDGSNGPQP
jgi:hypothetical protein